MRKRKRFADFKDHVTVEEVERRKFVIVDIFLAHLYFMGIIACNLDLSF